MNAMRIVASVGVVVAAAVVASAAPSRLLAQVPGEVRGRVSDAATARPVGDAQVEVLGRVDATRSGPDGAFTIRGLEPRAYTVRVRAVGYAPRDVDFEISNGRATTLALTLDPTAATLGAVVVRATRDTQAVNATVFDRRAIEASGRRDLTELLQTTPGVVITQSGGSGAASHVSIRGSGANEVLVLLDGVPLNSVLSGEADLSTISLETIERVTVRTGAQSARYGGRALAGVIDIQTRRSARDASAMLRAGAWGERNASASLGESRDVGTLQASGSLTGDYRTVQGDFSYPVPAVRGGGTARRFNSDVTSRQLLGRVAVAGDDGDLSARLSWRDLSRGLAGSIVQPSTTGREQQTAAGGGIDAHWRTGALSWTAAGDATQERAMFADSAPPFGTRYDDTVKATGLTASTTVTLGRGATTGSLGGEARSVDVASTMLTDGAPHWQRLLGAWGSYRTTQRIDRAKTELGGEVSARVDEASLTAGATFSPRVALSVSRAGVVASGAFGMGFAPPSLADQFFHEGVLVRANPNLQPERTRGDVEGRLTIQERDVGPFTLAGQGALFRADVDGMILWLPDFRFIWSPSNFAVHRSGWELSGRGTFPAARFDVEGSINRSDVVYAGPVLDGQVAYRPRTTANVTAGVTPRGVRLEVTNRFVGARRTVPGSGLNTLDPYWLTDARLTRSIIRTRWLVDAVLAVDNLFDRPAAMLVDYPFPGRTWSLALRIHRANARPIR
jgi:outer membrane cobalamin receptor